MPTSLLSHRREYAMVSFNLMRMVGEGEAVFLQTVYFATHNPKNAIKLKGAFFIPYTARGFQNTYEYHVTHDTINKMVKKLTAMRVLIQCEDMITIHYLNLEAMYHIWVLHNRPFHYSKSEDADNFKGACDFHLASLSEEKYWSLDDEDAQSAFDGLTTFSSTPISYDDFLTRVSAIFKSETTYIKRIKEEKSVDVSLSLDNSMKNKIATIFARWDMEHAHLETIGYKKPAPPVHPESLRNHKCQFDSIEQDEQKLRIQKARGILSKKEAKKVWIFDAFEKGIFGEDFEGALAEFERAIMVQVLIHNISIPRYENTIQNMLTRVHDYRKSIASIFKQRTLVDTDYTQDGGFSYDVPD